MTAMYTMQQKLQDGVLDEILCILYGCAPQSEELTQNRCRLLHIIDGYREQFGENEIELFSAPGRTELGGNHTDHQHGCVLAGSINLDIAACAAPNETRLVRIFSEGYGMEIIDLSDLSQRSEEINHTAALIRGIAAAISTRGYTVKGFDCYMTSNVLGGSGLSSSAAYGVAVGTIFNRFFCADSLDAVEIAQIGQYAENVYFGKPCGLLDQMACSIGGVVAMDFANPEAPVITRVAFDMRQSGYALCILDTGGDHKELTGAYAAIPKEMKAIAAQFGKEVLHDVEEQDFLHNIPKLRTVCGDRAVLRAFHFYAETKRAVAEAKALQRNDFAQFLQLVRESGQSSAMYLQNVDAGICSERQEMLFSLALAEKLLNGRGAVRVHGGGFAGTIQAFVPNDMLDNFQNNMDAVLGEGSCHVLTIRPTGGFVFTV